MLTTAAVEARLLQISRVLIELGRLRALRALNGISIADRVRLASTTARTIEDGHRILSFLDRYFQTPIAHVSWSNDFLTISGASDIASSSPEHDILLKQWTDTACHMITALRSEILADTLFAAIDNLLEDLQPRYPPSRQLNLSPSR